MADDYSPSFGTSLAPPGFAQAAQVDAAPAAEPGAAAAAANGGKQAPATPVDAGTEIARLRREVRAWKIAFWVAVGTGAVTTVGGTITGYKLGQRSGRKVMGLLGAGAGPLEG